MYIYIITITEIHYFLFAYSGFSACLKIKLNWIEPGQKLLSSAAWMTSLRTHNTTVSVEWCRYAVSQETACALEHGQYTGQPRHAPTTWTKNDVGYWPATFRFRSVHCGFLVWRWMMASYCAHNCEDILTLWLWFDLILCVYSQMLKLHYSAVGYSGQLVAKVSCR